jgi:hypothetical protein
MLLASSLEAWHTKRTMYRQLAVTCGAVAVAALALGALRPAPLVLVVVLVVLLSIPWVLAVRQRIVQAEAAQSGAGKSA